MDYFVKACVYYSELKKKKGLAGPDLWPGFATNCLL